MKEKTNDNSVLQSKKINTIDLSGKWVVIKKKPSDIIRKLKSLIDFHQRFLSYPESCKYDVFGLYYDVIQSSNTIVWNEISRWVVETSFLIR